MPPRSKTKKRPPPNKSAKKTLPPNKLAKKTLPPNKSAKASRKDHPVGNRNPVVGMKRKGPNSKTPSKPKRTKESSNSEVLPLTTADIPEIVAAVANANHRERPAQVRTSRRTLRSGNRTSQDDPPSGDAQPSSEEEGEEYEDFGQQLQNIRSHQLLSKAHKLMLTGLAKSSRITYSAGQRRYLHFCQGAKIKAILTSERTLMLFITHLAVSNASHGTIKVYLSAVRHMHICRGWHKHFRKQLTPRLLLILRGIKKCQADIHSVRKRLPITIQLLGRIRHLSKQPSYVNTTLWAMCCLAFFGFLRVSEFTIPTEGSYKPSCHLSLEDITMDNRSKPRLLQLFLKQSKRTHSNMGQKFTLVLWTQPSAQLRQSYLIWEEETTIQALFLSLRKEKAGQTPCSMQLSNISWRP